MMLLSCRAIVPGRHRRGRGLRAGDFAPTLMFADVALARIDRFAIETIPRIVAGGPDAAAFERLTHARLEAADHHFNGIEAMIDQPMGVPRFDADREQRVVKLARGVHQSAEGRILFRGAQVHGRRLEALARAFKKVGVSGKDDAIFNVAAQVAGQPRAVRRGGDHRRKKVLRRW